MEPDGNYGSLSTRVTHTALDLVWPWNRVGSGEPTRGIGSGAYGSDQTLELKEVAPGYLRSIGLEWEMLLESHVGSNGLTVIGLTIRRQIDHWSTSHRRNARFLHRSNPDLDTVQWVLLLTKNVSVMSRHWGDAVMARPVVDWVVDNRDVNQPWWIHSRTRSPTVTANRR
jgi:hypothetical protein